MAKLREIIQNLSQPIPYQWRVQSRNKDKTKAICTSFVDARDIQNLLDKHCDWTVKFRTEGDFVWCTIGIQTDDGIVYREDCGNRIEENKDDQMYEQAGKSAASDAFKRAAVMFGASRFLYDIPPVSLPCDQYGNVIDDKGQRVWDLTKHINLLNSSKGRKSPEQAAPVLGKEEPSGTIPAAPASLPDLQPKQFDAMVKAISDGKVQDVKNAMGKYKLNLAQKTTLNKLIKNEESKANAN